MQSYINVAVTILLWSDGSFHLNIKFLMSKTRIHLMWECGCLVHPYFSTLLVNSSNSSSSNLVVRLSRKADLMPFLASLNTSCWVKPRLSIRWAYSLVIDVSEMVGLSVLMDNLRSLLKYDLTGWVA